MRIEHLRVEGFGQFHQREWGPLHPGLTIIYGPNEAGKSTLLAFIRAILFGFVKGNVSENRYLPDVSTAYGGQLEVVCSQETRWVVERLQKNKSTLRVFCDGAPVDAEEGLRKLIGSANRELFHKVFAISLTELQQFEALNEDRVQDALFGAGLGSSGVSSVENRLRARAGDLFKPGGSKSRLALALTERAEVEKGLKLLRKGAEEHSSLAHRLQDYLVKVDVLERECEQYRGEEHRLGRWMQAAAPNSELQELRGRYQGLTLSPDFPADGLARLETLEMARVERVEAITVASSVVNSVKDQLARSSIPDELLLQNSVELEFLASQILVWQQAKDRLPTLQMQIEQERALLRRKLDLHGFSGSLEELRQLRFSIGLRDQLATLHIERDSLRTRLGASQLQLASADETVRRRLESYEQLQLEVEKSRTGRPEKPTCSVSELQDLRSLLTELGRRDAQRTAAFESWLQAVQDMGGEWSPETVLRALNTTPRVEEIGRHAEQLEEDARRNEQAQQRVTAAAQMHDAAEARQLLLRERLQELAPSKYSREEISQLRRLLRQRERLTQDAELYAARQGEAADRLQNLQNESAGGNEVVIPFFLPVLLATGGLWAGTVFWWKGEFRFALLALTLSLTIAWICWKVRSLSLQDNRRRTYRLQTQINELQVFLSRLKADHQAVLNEGEILEQLLPPELAAAVNWEEDLDRIKNHLELWTTARTLLEEAEAEVERLRGSLEAARLESTSRGQQYESGLSEWNRWQADHHLSPTHPRVQISVVTRLQQVAGTHRSWRKLESEVADLYTRLSELSALSGLGDSKVSSELLDRLLEDARIAQEQAGLERDLQEKLDAAKIAWTQACHERERAEQVQTELRSLLDEHVAHLEELLAREGLPAGLSPDTAARVMDALASAQEGLGSLDRLIRERAAAETVDQELQFRTARLAQCLGTPDAPDITWLTVKLQALQASKDCSRARDELNTKRLEAEQRLQAATDSLANTDARLTELLSLGESEDGEDFRRRYKEQVLAAELSAKIGEIERSLDLLGVREEERLALSGLTTMELSSRLERIREERIQRETQLVALRDEMSRCAVELEALERSEEVARQSLRLRSLDAQIEADAMEWARQIVASHLVQLARETFQRERQPEVVRRAQQHFARMTAGHYPHLYAVLGTRELAVESLHRKRREPSQLSRGTAEQLYLALRLGFIEDFCHRSEPLPVILDDIFVNFDDGRAEQTMSLLGDFSRKQQVILFTCHRTTAERAHQICPESALIELGR